MTKYLITGSSGFVGKNLFERFSKDQLYLYERGQDVEHVLSTFQPDVIFHLAAEIYNEAEMYESNVQLTHNLLKYSKDIPYKAFIYVGSSSEYGRKDHPMKETDFLDPTTMYEATKGAASLLCLGYARTYQKPIMIARPFSLYGKYEPDHRFIPTLFSCARTGNYIDLAPGNHDFVHINDFVDGLLLLANNPKPGLIVNFGSGIQHTNQAVLEMIESITKRNIKTRLVGKLRPFDSDCWVCDTSLAKSLGWKPTINLYEGLEKLCHHS